MCSVHLLCTIYIIIVQLCVDNYLRGSGDRGNLWRSDMIVMLDKEPPDLATRRFDTSRSLDH